MYTYIHTYPHTYIPVARVDIQVWNILDFVEAKIELHAALAVVYLISDQASNLMQIDITCIRASMHVCVCVYVFVCICVHVCVYVCID